MAKKIQATITQDLYVHVEAIKEYFSYGSISQVINKALENLVNEHDNNEIYKYYLQRAKTRRSKME